MSCKKVKCPLFKMRKNKQLSTIEEMPEDINLFFFDFKGIIFRDSKKTYEEIENEIKRKHSIYMKIKTGKKI